MTYYAQPPAPAATSNDAEKRALEEKTKLLADQLAALERARLSDQHRAELEKVRADNERQLEEMKRLVAAKTDDKTAHIEGVLAKLIEKLDAKPAGPPPEVVAMQHKLELLERERAQQAINPQVAALEAQLKTLAEANAKQADQMQRERDRADAERREAAMIARMEKQAADTAAALAAIQAKPTGPDPTMMLIVDMMKNSAAQAQMQLERQQAMMLKPQDIIALTKESSNGLDDVKRSMTGLFTDVFSMQKQVMEQAMQFAPQGESPTVRLIEGGIVAAKEAFERYGQGKTTEAVTAAKAQGEYAKAQAEQMRLQQMQLQVMAQQEAQARQPALNGVNPPENANPNADVNGVSDDGTRATQAEAAARTAPSIEVVDATSTEAGSNGHGTVPKRLGRTDAEWFGAAMPEVEKLRAGVAKFLKNIALKKPKLDPQTHQPVGIAPALATEAILKAADKIVTLGVTVPAFSVLFLEGRMDEFMEILLPDAPYPYRSDVAANVMATMQAMQASAEGGDEDDEGDDEGDDETADA